MTTLKKSSTSFVYQFFFTGVCTGKSNRPGNSVSGQKDGVFIREISPIRSLKDTTRLTGTPKPDT